MRQKPPTVGELRVAKIPTKKKGIEIIDGIEINIDAKIKEINTRLKKLISE